MNEKRKKVWTKVFNILYWLLVSGAGLSVLYGAVHVFCLTSFPIPSNSMEPTLIAGDRILVEKFTMGARLFDLKPAFNKEQFTILRTPALGKVKRNDILVFNYPYPEREDSIGFDVMLYYVKRCIALPGDTLEIRNSHYRIRGQEEEVGHVKAQDWLERLFKDKRTDERGIYIHAYPYDAELGWTIRDMGPYYIPKEGESICMNHINYRLYKPVIEWEQQQPLREVNDMTFTLGGKQIVQYTFQKNYYFVGGDRMENSKDSRYWGVLPEEYIVGRVCGIWKSVDEWGEMRWERIGRL